MLRPDSTSPKGPGDMSEKYELLSHWDFFMSLFKPIARLQSCKMPVFAYIQISSVLSSRPKEPIPPFLYPCSSLNSRPITNPIILDSLSDFWVVSRDLGHCSLMQVADLPGLT
jgi:hypothetical protein